MPYKHLSLCTRYPVLTVKNMRSASYLVQTDGCKMAQKPLRRLINVDVRGQPESHTIRSFDQEDSVVPLPQTQR